MTAYLAFRVAVDLLKPEPRPLAGGLTAIQWACLGGLTYYTTVFARRRTPLEAT
jgi:hypothetical protein